MAKDDGGDYNVGYGKPPRENRFKKGQSGNPKGRPRASKNMRSIIHEIAEERVEVTIKGKRRNIPVREALARRLFSDAMKGNYRAQRLALDLLDKHDPVARPHYVIQAPARLTEEEWKIKHTPGYGVPMPVNPTPESLKADESEVQVPPNPSKPTGTEDPTNKSGKTGLT